MFGKTQINLVFPSLNRTFAPTMKESINDFEIMAPVGSRDSLAAALKAGLHRCISEWSS